MSNIVRAASEKIFRGPSPTLWGDISKIEDDARMGKCAFVFDDFFSVPVINSNTAAAGGDQVQPYSKGGLTVLYDNTNIVRGQTSVVDLDDEVGVLEVQSTGTQNDEVYVSFNGSQNVFVVDRATTGQSGKIIMEARFAVNTITDNASSYFIGLTELPLAANQIVDAGALADKGFLGFYVEEADNDLMTFSYNETSGSEVDIGNTAVALTYTRSDGFVTSYKKVGFVYDPAAVDVNKRIRWYVDGVEQNTYVTDTQIAASDFPEGQPLGLAALLKTEGAATSLRLDWIGGVQYCGGDED